MMFNPGFGVGGGEVGVMFLIGALRFAFWFAVVVGAVWLVALLIRNASRSSAEQPNVLTAPATPRVPTEKTPLDIAAERLAKSEITPAEYAEIAAALRSTDV